MKMKRSFLILLVVLLCFCVAGCGAKTVAENLWDSATYTDDTELGNGAKTLLVKVEAQEKSVLFTIHTDAKTVGDAMAEHKLISGEEGAYGLYVKEVNGIVADYDKDKSYWAFNKEGEAMTTGVDGAEFSDGEQFELAYTK